MSIGEKKLQLAKKKNQNKKQKIGKLNKSLGFFFLDIESTDFRRKYATEKADQ